MIHWLVETAAEHPDMISGAAPEGWLAPAELERLAGFKVEKRRRDWLLGRWVAKQLVQQCRFQVSGTLPQLTAIVIDVDADGAPFAVLHEPDGVQRLSWSLSISHSQGIACCALLVQEEGGRHAVGVDIEHIEPRAANFISDFFTSDEAALVEQASPRQHDLVVTAVWSAKEAVLKALRTGLRRDTRTVECLIRPPLPLTEEWVSFPIRLLGDAGAGGTWSGWWRRPVQYPDCVLTMALNNIAE